MPRARMRAICLAGSNPRTRAVRARPRRKARPTGRAISLGTEQVPVRAVRLRASFSTAGCATNAAISGFRRTRRCSKMPGATGLRLAASRSTSSRWRPGSWAPPSPCARAFSSSPTRPCVRPETMQPASIRSWHGLVPCRTRSSMSSWGWSKRALMLPGRPARSISAWRRSQSRTSRSCLTRCSALIRSLARAPIGSNWKSPEP